MGPLKDVNGPIGPLTIGSLVHQKLVSCLGLMLLCGASADLQRHSMTGGSEIEANLGFGIRVIMDRLYGCKLLEHGPC